MFSKNFQRKYALTDQGLRNVRKGAFWTVIVNLVVMAGMGILYLLMGGFMGTLTEGASLPGPLLFAGLTVLFVVLSFVTHLQQYQATYGLVYNEVKGTRLSLAERLRKLPLGYFGKRDLADLTETIMGDVNRMEHVWSHVLGYLRGAYISTAIIAVCLLVYDWRLTIACLWGVPVAFALLFGARKLTARASERTKAAALRVSDGIQEALENVREIRAANQEARYLEGLNQKIDEHETVTIRGELGTGIFVNAASVIMRLGVATTILVGADLILSGQIDFILLSCSCWSSPGCTRPSTRAWHSSRRCSSPRCLPTASTRSMIPRPPGGRIPSSPRATTLCLNMWASPMTKRRCWTASASPRRRER